MRDRGRGGLRSRGRRETLRDPSGQVRDLPACEAGHESQLHRSSGEEGGRVLLDGPAGQEIRCRRRGARKATAQGARCAEENEKRESGHAAHRGARGGGEVAGGRKEKSGTPGGGVRVETEAAGPHSSPRPGERPWHSLTKLPD